MQINFGEQVLEVSLERLDLEDLLHSKTNALSSEIFHAIKEAVLKDMRDSIQDSNLSKAQQFHGYMNCLEDLIRFYAVDIPDSLR